MKQLAHIFLVIEVALVSSMTPAQRREHEKACLDLEGLSHLKEYA